MAQYIGEDRKRWSNGSKALDPKDVLAANGYLVNLTTGQGAGYDPLMLANFSRHDFVVESVDTQSKPNLDNADPYSVKIQDGKAISSMWTDPNDRPYKHAFNQEDFNGVGPSLPDTYQVNFVNQGPGTPDTADNINDFPVIFYNLDGDSDCANAVSFRETNVPKAVIDDLEAQGYNLYKLTNPSGGMCLTNNLAAPFPNNPVIRPNAEIVKLANNPPPARIGQFTDPSPITGGVDAVSALIMRDSVINEWMAKNDPTATFCRCLYAMDIDIPNKAFLCGLDE